MQFESRRILNEQEGLSIEEKRILDLLDRGLSRDFPNPERIGCPDSAFLKGVARHRVQLSEAEQWLNHLSSCSPCFQEFSRYRAELTGRRRLTQMTLAVAAVILFVIAGWLWVRSRPSGQTAAVAVLDLRDRAAVRGESEADTGQKPLVIPRSAKNLNLELPIGSNEGAYEVAVLNANGAELFRTRAVAKLEDHIVVLKANVDLAGLSPGSYFLGLRQAGLDWARFPIRLL